MRLAATVAALAVSPGGAFASSAAEAWAKAFVKPGETLECTKELSGELFFVARTDNRVKVGYRLIVEDPSGFSYSTSWSIQNRAGESLIAKIPPSSVISRMSKSSHLHFAESVDYQTVTNPGDVAKASLRIKKCRYGNCDVDLSKPPAGGSDYLVEVCAVKG